jgi:hypothetical protein
MATVFTEGRHAGEFILSEASGKRSREAVVIAAEQTIAAGAVLALLAQEAGLRIDDAADDGNTGDGTLDMADPAVSAKVKHGTYTVIFTGATSFKVEDPDGKEIGTGATGAAFNKEVKFTITAGTTPFAAGDRFYISVIAESPADYEAVAFDPTASDGSEKAAAIAIYPATTGSGETVKIAALVRDAEVNGHCLTWPAGITAAQKEAAIADLAKVGIIVR